MIEPNTSPDRRALVHQTAVNAAKIFLTRIERAKFTLPEAAVCVETFLCIVIMAFAGRAAEGFQRLTFASDMVKMLATRTAGRVEVALQKSLAPKN